MVKLRVGIVGLGKISGIYLDNLTGMFAQWVDVVGVTDLMKDRVDAVTEAYGLKGYTDYAALLAEEKVDLILNLTTPQSHYQLCREALLAGKHVYVEKPLSLNTKEAGELVSLAAERGLFIGGAPDTFLGSGIQTCRKLIDEGWIGRPIAASAFMMNHGHESWHPDPEFYYKDGAGPLFDMGPYYITALVNLLGPVKAVNGVARKSFATRTITSEPKAGTVVDVEVDTHVTGILEFDSGAVATLVTSFDVWHHQMPNIEIYGSEGTLRVPDPNTFGGPIRYCRKGSDQWIDLPLLFDYEENSRGLGVADFAWALQTDSKDGRAGGELALHIVDVMQSILASAERGQRVDIGNQCKQPQPRNP
ncbi:MAG: Gfo/Idh/MocA family oxidoreductase [Sphaerochaeta sp.]